MPLPVRDVPAVKPISTKAHSAGIAVKDRVAEVTVSATFHNPNSFQMEGTYWFPLPAGAAIQEFQMEINGKRVDGELVEAQRARKIYEDIVRRRKDPALLEWVGSQMLKCRVFPMPAGKDTKVGLAYTQVLQQDGGLVSLRYPLRSAKPSSGKIGQLAMRVAIKSRRPLKAVYSATHEFDIHRPSDREASLTFEGRDVDPARDVEILFSRDDKDIGLTVISHKAGPEPGTFLLMVSPQIEMETDQVIEKDVIFVCDTSGSMKNDNKLEQAKKALKFCLGRLRSGDRFRLVTFSGEVRFFRKGLTAATPENVEAAQTHVDSLKAVGGTALNDALLAATKTAEPDGRVVMTIVLTDGNPTIGEQNPEAILKNVTGTNTARSRFFVFGVGYDLNAKLLDKLAERNRGTREYVKPGEDIEARVTSFYSKVSNPILSDLALDFGDAEVTDLYPRSLSDLFHGGQLTMLGRFSKTGRWPISLTGRAGDQEKRYTYEGVFRGTPSHDYLPKLWALRKVAFLLDEIRLHGESRELVDEVVRLGKRYGIVTPYTSFLIVEEDAPISPAWRKELDEAGRVARSGFAKRMGGRGAVADSVSLARAKGSHVASAPGQVSMETVFGFGGGKGGEKEAAVFGERLRKTVRARIRRVGARTFYVRADGTWVDSLYEDTDKARLRDIRLWSEAFFALVRRYRDVGAVLMETSDVILFLDGVPYRIR